MDSVSHLCSGGYGALLIRNSPQSTYTALDTRASLDTKDTVQLISGRFLTFQAWALPVELDGYAATGNRKLAAGGAAWRNSDGKEGSMM